MMCCVFLKGCIEYCLKHEKKSAYHPKCLYMHLLTHQLPKADLHLQNLNNVSSKLYHIEKS